MESQGVTEEFQSATRPEPQTRGNSFTRKGHDSTIPSVGHTNTNPKLQRPRKRSRSRTKTSTLPNQNDYLLKTNLADELAFPPLFTWVRKKGAMTDRILAKVHKSLSNKSTAYCRSRERTRDELIFKRPNGSQYMEYSGKHARKKVPKMSSTEASRRSPGRTGHKNAGKTVAFRKSSSLVDKPISPTMMRSRHKSSFKIGDPIVRSSLAFTFGLAERFSNRSTGSLPASLTIDDNIRYMEMYLNDLSLVSAKFISTFVPNQQVDSNIVTRKIWGSVEEITRVGFVSTLTRSYAYVST